MPSNRAVNFSRGQSATRFSLSTILIVWTLLRFHNTHDPADRLWLTALLIVFVAGVVSFLPNVLEAPDSGVFSKSFRIISALLLFTGVVLGSGYQLTRPGLWETLESEYKRLSVYVGPSLTFLSTLALAAVGYGFFILKTKKLLQYAYLEIAFALVSCYVAVNRAKQGLSIGTVTVIGAAVYLIVRGLDNRQKALAESSGGRLAK
jgi:hypothetical protein